MKDSGIAWVGMIPDDWKVEKLKAHLRREEPRNPGYMPVLSLYRELGVVPKDSRDDNHNVTSEDTSTYKYVRVGDFVVNKMKAWQGSVAVSEYEGVVSPAYFVYHFTDSVFDKRFFHYLLRGCYKDEFLRLSAGIRIGQWDLPSDTLDNIPTLVPPSDTQRRIAAYLDQKCAIIDALISKHQAVIEKLKEYKLSFITEAVTKGLNPDVEMLDTGIRYFGFIPFDWTITRLKFLLSEIIDCPHETPEYSNDGDYSVIRTADQGIGFLRSENNMLKLSEAEYRKRTRRMTLDKDDIVYGREGERWGIANIVPISNHYCLGQRMMQFRCRTEMVLPEFLAWALNSRNVYVQGSFDTLGSTSPHVNISTMINYYIPIPPIDEQRRIATHVATESSRVERSIAARESLITKLAEYKKSLIYEVVTGKKEV